MWVILIAFFVKVSNNLQHRLLGRLLCGRHHGLSLLGGSESEQVYLSITVLLDWRTSELYGNCGTVLHMPHSHT
jgi:hypothetical protein